MRAHITAVASLLFVAALSGCNTAASHSAAESAAPAVQSAVGPIPGASQHIAYRTNPFAGNAVAIQEGRKLFLWYNCYGCHGGHAGGGMGPSLRDATWLYGDRDDQVFDSIAQGRGQGMPTWGTKIPEDQIWKLVAYIKTMQTPQEADPPTMPAEEKVPGPSTKPAVNTSQYKPAQ